MSHYFFCPLIDNIFYYSVALMSKGLAPVRGSVIAHQQFNFFSRKYCARIIAGTMKGSLKKLFTVCIFFEKNIKK